MYKRQLLEQHLEASHLQNTDEKNKEATRTHIKADAHATDLPDLRPEDRVWIQYHQTKEWYKQATVVQSRHNGRAYELIDDEGKTYYREGDSYGRYRRAQTEMRSQSIGATQQRWKDSLTQTWNQPSPPTQPFCPATNTKKDRKRRMSMSTIGFVIHALRPSIPEKSLLCSQITI